LTSHYQGKYNIITLKETNGKINNIHGMWHQGIIMHWDIIKDQQLQQILEVITMHGQRKRNYVTINYQQLTPERINYGCIDNQQWQHESKNMRKSYYVVSSCVKPLTTKFLGQSFSKGFTM
jgi:hypothetical protein